MTKPDWLMDIDLIVSEVTETTIFYTNGSTKPANKKNLEDLLLQAISEREKWRITYQTLDEEVYATAKTIEAQTEEEAISKCVLSRLVSSCLFVWEHWQYISSITNHILTNTNK